MLLFWDVSIHCSCPFFGQVSYLGRYLSRFLLLSSSSFGTWNWTQDLAPARQMLMPLSYIPSPLQLSCYLYHTMDTCWCFFVNMGKYFCRTSACKGDCCRYETLIAPGTLHVAGLTVLISSAFSSLHILQVSEEMWFKNNLFIFQKSQWKLHHRTT